MSVRTVTALARTNAADERVHVERVARGDDKRPGGRRFGTLVHALLAVLDLNAQPNAILSAAKLHERLVDAADAEIEAAASAVVGALEHPLMRRAAGAASANLRRETPILLGLADDNLAEGVVDLAFREEAPGFAGWTVVDFKSDGEFEPSRARYTAQVGYYVEAIEKSTKLPARGLILVV
jgi:ATP-dependent exoDNAse (exonuclease V) beta subunit